MDELVKNVKQVFQSTTSKKKRRYYACRPATGESIFNFWKRFESLARGVRVNKFDRAHDFLAALPEQITLPIENTLRSRYRFNSQWEISHVIELLNEMGLFKPKKVTKPTNNKNSQGRGWTYVDLSLTSIY